MKQQPATKSYFFDKGYKDIAKVMKKTWANAFKPIKNEFDRLKKTFSKNFIAGIFALLCDLVVFSVITIFIMTINSIFSVLFTCFFVLVGIFVYLGYTFLFITDYGFRVYKQISSQCPVCQIRVGLPAYKCPKCGVLHTELRPSQYGILQRRCQCGNKIPTTFFNGRQKLAAFCPGCGHNLKDGGIHSELMIPVVGGPSAGKTCLINMAINQIEKVAPQYNLVYKYSPAIGDEYLSNKQNMEKGIVPDKTSDTRLRYYQFYLTPRNETVKTLISICDVAGETYEDTDTIGNQIGYKYANAFVMVVDPLSVLKFREEIIDLINVKEYGASERGMDEILSMLISTLENMHCLNSKNMIKTDVVVVFTKCDIPTIDSKIGATAVRKYMQANHITSKYDATNKVCEEFLKEYEETNFINTLKSKFRSVQFFTSSALGHVQNGSKFNPEGVDEPLLWIIDKVSKSIDLSSKWGKRL